MSEHTLMKDKLGRDAILELNQALSNVISDFPAEAFIEQACLGLEQYELKQRVDHLIAVLARFLPQDFRQTAALLVALKQQWPDSKQTSGGFSFSAWPVIDYVAVYGLEHPELALDVLEILTPLFSAEFAVRPFIEQHFEITHPRMMSWAQHDDEHVRRLASEGIRPRLPWGKRLSSLCKTPDPIFELLELLKSDSSVYVRKSVANNLNDITKDNPDKVIECCKQWNQQATAETKWIIKHALRSLIKSGHPDVFELLGYSASPKLSVINFELSQAAIILGQELELSLSLKSESTQQQSIVLDYKVSYVKANGKLTSKVFKWKNMKLAPMQQYGLSKKHGFKPISTRKYYSGEHQVEIMINGVSYSKAVFQLTA